MGILKNKTPSKTILIIFLLILTTFVLSVCFGSQYISGKPIELLAMLLDKLVAYPPKYYSNPTDKIILRTIVCTLITLFVLSLFVLFREKPGESEEKISIKLQILVVLLALCIGIYAQYPTLTNTYIFWDSESPLNFYWMHQFKDNELFRNDLSVESVKRHQPWGFIFLYYLLSFFVDPIVVSKVLSIFLSTVSSLYMFKLVRYFLNNYSAFLASLASITSSIFLYVMNDGLPGAFAFPLLIIFLYYLIRKEYLKASLFLILQILFYPIVFFISILTYSMTFIRFKQRKVFFDSSTLKRQFFLFALLICSIVLLMKYCLFYNPLIGSLYTKNQMINMSDFYEGGREAILPQKPILSSILGYIARSIGSFYLVNNFVANYLEINIFQKKEVFIIIGASILLIWLIFALSKKKISIPVEIIFLFIASVLMYKIADLFLLKFYFPSRYLKFSIHLIVLIFSSVFINWFATVLKALNVEKIFKVIILVLIFLNFYGTLYLRGQNSSNFLDLSREQKLYSYLSTLPKHILIASEPWSASGIPLFSRRKVFIHGKVLCPFYDKYWEVMKKRIFDFFNAYYSTDYLSIYDFCEKNKIDYLVVDKRHFTKAFLNREKIYFEPFNTHIKSIVKDKKRFALEEILKEDKLFVRGKIFVISKDALKKYI